MKNNLIFLFFLLLLCSTLSAQSESPIAYSETDSLIGKLSSDDFGGRATGTADFDSAAEYAIRFFQQNEILPFYENYKKYYTKNGKHWYNLVGINQKFDPNKKTILISAHLDHLPVSPGEDSIMNGANDNATGVTAALQISKYLNAQNSIDENIIIALFSAEEIGLIGSRELAIQMREDGLKPDYMINFEMLGVPMQNNPNSVYLTGSSKSNMDEILNQASTGDLVVDIEEAESLFRASDNYSFYNILKIPAHTVSSFDFKNYEYYHHHDDEYDNIDVSFLNTIINRLALSIQQILEEYREIILQSDN